ncbi:MAG: DUF1801 domain-containing protein [Candidatus Heimdallarchaeota archaeon]|nr:DUF1801 domain-containing protein [Candidatus Heimdallarchaeota archaeon]
MSNKKLATIDEYIATFPEKTQEILKKIRKIIHDSTPHEVEETISYQIPTFKLKKKNLVHFAAYKHHIGFYPTSSGIEEFKNELSSYETSKGTVRFPIKDSIPYELIRKIVHYRVLKILSKKKQ